LQADERFADTVVRWLGTHRTSMQVESTACNAAQKCVSSETAVFADDRGRVC
jgi:hypothetical protein